MTGDGWSPVVYGRTRSVDRWWRALPLDVEPEWAAGVVRAATAGGIGLDERPRFVLAQGPRHRLVGGACLARELSSTMNTDGRRALYCFVGWVSAWQGRWPDVPALGELEAAFGSWATPVYERWMALDWDLHETQVAGPHESHAEPAPWPSVRPPDSALPPAAAGQAPLAWPQDLAADAWDLLRASDAPRLLVAGWQHASDADVGAEGWIAAADVARVTVLAAPAAVEPDAPPARTYHAVPDVSPEPPVRPGDAASTEVVHAPSEAGSLATPAEIDIETLVQQTWSRVGHIPASTPHAPEPPRPETEDDDAQNMTPRRRRRDGRLLGRALHAVGRHGRAKPDAGTDGMPHREPGTEGARDSEPDDRDGADPEPSDPG